MYYLKEIFSSFQEAEQAALKVTCKQKPKVAALWGMYPNIQKVTIEFLCTIGDDEPENSSVSGTDESGQTTN